jgi:outer membrane murein-binding lipoprotein Lpp
MYGAFKKTTLIAALGGALALGGCASVDDVKHAQATADQALDAAHHAQSTADQAMSGVNSLDGRVQALEQQMQSLKSQPMPSHRGQRG